MILLLGEGQLLVEVQVEHLKAEGHTVIEGKGKHPPKVKDFESYLVKLQNGILK